MVLLRRYFRHGLDQHFAEWDGACDSHGRDLSAAGRRWCTSGESLNHQNVGDARALSEDAAQLVVLLLQLQELDERLLTLGSAATT